MKRKSLKAPFLVLYFSRHWQALKTSISQLKESLASTMITCLVIGVALALPMGMMVFLHNVRLATHTFKSSGHISVYLKTDISTDQQKELVTLLKTDQAIQKIRYISPEEGITNFQKQIHLGEDFFKSFDKNPLPGVILITPAPSITNPLELSQLADRLQKLPHVDQVQSDMAWMQRLQAILLLLHRFIFSLMLLFAFGVLLIVSHTIQLVTENHREEIMIVKLLGASDRFVRRPFLYSGILYGLFGAIVAWILIGLIILGIEGPVNQLVSLYQSNFVLQGLDIHTGLVLILFGCLLGYFGSWGAVRKQMRE